MCGLRGWGGTSWDKGVLEGNGVFWHWGDFEV